MPRRAGAPTVVLFAKADLVRRLEMPTCMVKRPFRERREVPVAEGASHHIPVSDAHADRRFY
jgi:hypothetical protein